MALLAISSAGLAQPPQPPQRPTPSSPAFRNVKSRPSDPNKLPPLSLFPAKTLWTLSLNNQLTAPPAYDAKRAYFSIEGGRLVAYEIKTGEQQWTVSIKPEMEPTTGDGLLFVVEAKTLTALRTADGKVAWQRPLEEKLAVRPVWDNGWLVLATAGGTIVAFRALDGLQVWTRDLPSPANAPPALAADRVYVPAKNDRVVALRVDNGTPVWERRLGGSPNDILALDERLYVGSKDNFLYCIDATDGEVRWRWRTGGNVVGRPVVDEKTVYFGSFDNVLRALSRKSGVQQWIRPLPFRPTTGTLLASGTVIVSGLSPGLRGFNADDGMPAGDLPGEGEMAAPPHLVDGGGGSLPLVVVVRKDIAKGASVLLITRSVEPGFVPFAAMPDPVVRLTNPGGPEAPESTEKPEPAKGTAATPPSPPRPTPPR